MIKLIIIAAAAIVFVAVFRDSWNDLRQKEHEYDEFERRRAERQAQIDRQNQAIARRVLIEQCETLYIGRWQHDGN